MKRLHGRERHIVDAYEAGAKLRSILPWASSNELIYRALRRHGVTERRRHSNPDWWEDVADLRRGGQPIAHIAVWCGRSRRAVQYALDQLGLRNGETVNGR